MNIDKLGNGVGKLYVTEPDGTTYIYNDLPNDKGGTETVKYHSLTRASEGFPIAATGSVEFVTIGAIDSVTSLTIDGVEQLSSTFGITPGAEALAAANVAASINGNNPVSGVNYQAHAIDGKIIIESTSVAGSSVNGHVVVITVGLPGSQTITIENIDGGSEGGEIISTINGARYFLDATDAAVPSGVGSPGTEEITQFLVMRGVQSQHPIIQQTIASSSLIDIERYDRFSVLELGAGSNTSLKSISGSFAVNDILVLQNTSAFTVTVDDLSITSGNIKLNPTTFAMTTDDQILWLMYMEDDVEGLVWRELYRNPSTVAAGSITSTELAALSVGTTELAALSVTEAKIALGVITNALMASSSIDTAQLITDAVTTIKILDANITTAKMALLSVDDTILAANSVITTKILDANVTLEKLESDLHKDFFVVPISFDTGRLGIFEVKVPFDLTVTEVLGSVTELIEATDDKTFIGKNNAGTAWTGGQIDFTGGAVFGNSFTSSPTGNNAYLAGQVIRLETLASTPGGNVTLTICYTRD